MSSFLGTEGAILYSDGASAATSTIAAFAKRGDLLIVDEGVNEALLVGVTLSRANVRYFRHNNMRDLRKVLEKIKTHDESCHRHSSDQRRFLIVEGVYRNWGTIAPLDEIVKLKEEFCYRLILDDTHGMGVLGPTGRGTLERFGLRPMIHAEIVTFSLEYSFGSVGGMTVGCEEVVDHQRLSGAGYCFSASAPPFLSKVCLASIRRLEGRLDDLMIDNEDDEHTDDDELSSIIPHSPRAGTVAEDLSGPALLERLHENVSSLYGMLTNSSHPYALKLHNRLVITSHPQSPIIYLRLADDEAIGRTRTEQTVILDQISRHCLLNGHVAIVSTGGHVKKNLQLVPEPCLRLVTNVGQTNDDFELLVKALGSAVESILVCNDDMLE
jgi:serine palmitoyltransferase